MVGVTAKGATAARIFFEPRAVTVKLPLATIEIDL
jgi:hypothetical protein